MPATPPPSLNKRAWRTALITFVALRLFFSLWAAVALAASPLPAEADETLRPYLGATPLDRGLSGLLLGPWQRFDSNRYVRLAGQGYAHAEDSVFPPLYPLLLHLAGAVLPAAEPSTAYLLAGILVSNFCTLLLFWLLFRLAASKVGLDGARRSVIYLALFPTAFFLFAAYSESLFILLALAALLAAERGRNWVAGTLGLLASLTRLTGVGLVLPLLCLLGRQEGERGIWPLLRRWPRLLPAAMPGAGFLLFLLLRHSLGLPSLSQVYARSWYQSTGFPGHDLATALGIMVTGQGVRAGELTLWLDFATFFLLAAMTWLSFRRLGPAYGLYAAVMLLFMLLPRSDLKPLYSFTRYTLAIFPMFIVWGEAGKNPWLHRLILYPSLLLLLYFSGQFFIWGWVA